MAKHNFAMLDLARMQQLRDDQELCTINVLSASSREIILSLLRYSEFVATRWFAEGDVNTLGHLTIDEREQAQQFSGLAHEEIILGCTITELVDALNGIATASAGGGACCNGSGGQGSDTPAEDFEDNGVDPPGGFDDYDEYSVHKCDAAQYAIDTWLADIDWMIDIDTSVYAVASLAVGLIGGAILTPGVNVLMLVGILILALSDGAYVDSLTDVKDWIADEAENILCAIYLAQDATDARQNVLDLIDASTLTSLQQHIAGYFATQASINLAFQDSNIPPSVNGDCVACDCPAYYILYGSDDEGDGSEFTSEITGSDRQEVRVFFSQIPGEAVCDTGVDLASITWLSGNAPNAGFSIRADQGGSETYNFIGSTAISNFNAWLPKSNVTKLWLNRSNSDGQKHEEFSIAADWSEA